MTPFTPSGAERSRGVAFDSARAERKFAVLLASLFAAGGCVRRGVPPLLPASDGGSVAPLELVLPRFGTGEAHALASDRGSVVLLDVWATWCEPCKDALPLVEQLAAANGPRGFRAYAVSIDADPREVSRFVAETKLALPVLLDPDADASEHKLGVRLMPTSFLLDRAGRVRFVHEGFDEHTMDKTKAELDLLLAEPAP